LILSPQVPRALAPLLQPARYKGAHGGRGSGKSHFFAEMMIARCVASKTDAVCIREIQKSLKQSAKKLLENKIEALGVAGFFQSTEVEIRGANGSLIIFQGMQDHTAETIKSLEDFDIAWVEEAQTLSQTSLTLLRPTIRAPGSELWFSWNPRRKTDPVDALLRGDKQPTGAKVVTANWADNPWFPAELEQERRDDLRDRSDQYDHIWEGDYAKVTEGAYFAQALTLARSEKRITELAPDPLLQRRAFWDIGVADHTAIWIAQFNGRKIDVIDYVEAVGQPLAYYVAELRDRGHGNALCVLPHDGADRDAITAVKFEDHLRSAGFTVQTVKNQGKGAAMLRVEAARRLFPRIWFNKATTEAGVDALGAYHERIDEKRNVGLGPEHDWASHGADAFGLMCIAYEEPPGAKPKPRQYAGAGGWMG
jgi:phage terminase large subunit